jgi:hypothetical protein
LGKNLLPDDIRDAYQIEERHHASSILKTDFPQQWKDLVEVLREFKLRKTDCAKKGGNKSPIARAIDGLFFERGWVEKSFEIKVTADGHETLAPTHHVDYYKSRIAVETEWNNKDPFFDRDLTTFRLLFELNVLSVGIIITRADELQELFIELGNSRLPGNQQRTCPSSFPRCIIARPVVAPFLLLASPRKNMTLIPDFGRSGS